MRTDGRRWAVALVLLVGLGLGTAGQGARAARAPALPEPGEAAMDACWPGEEPDEDAGYPQWSDAPELVIEEDGAYAATLETGLGEVEIALLPAEAPATVNNFVCLALAGYYDGVGFHRVVPGFVIQGGDPTGTGAGGPGYEFADEEVRRDYEPGTVAMANAGPDTNGSQFFVVLEGGEDQLQPLYTIFGEVADGLEVVEAIGETDPEGEPVEIERVTIAEGGEGGEGEPGATVIAERTYLGVVFDEAGAEELWAGLGTGVEADGFWVPGGEDVRALEAGIGAFLGEAAEGGDVADDLVERLPGYTRQYAGVELGGERVVVANFFCDDLGADWRREPVLVEDGGDCFFRVTFDPATGRFSDLTVNGES